MTLGLSGLRPTPGFFVLAILFYFLHNFGRLWNVKEVGFASSLVVGIAVVVCSRAFCVTNLYVR